MELIVVEFRDATGKRWSAAGQLATVMVPQGGGEERQSLAGLEALGPVVVETVKVVRG